jgi:hypothetical protein
MKDSIGSRGRGTKRGIRCSYHRKAKYIHPDFAVSPRAILPVVSRARSAAASLGIPKKRRRHHGTALNVCGKATAYSWQKAPEEARRVQRVNATYSRIIESIIPIIGSPPF